MNNAEVKAYIASTRARQAAYAATNKGVPMNVRLGPRGAEVIERARWKDQDEYPSYQYFADELERLLDFADRHGQLAPYFARLSATTGQRDSALDELRVAVHLDKNGFAIIEWNPVGLTQKEGEYLVSGPLRVQTFVEVKSPTWQSELTDEEIAAGRAKEPKYQFCEGRNFALWQNIQYAVEKAYGKFLPVLANLLVIPGEGTFVSMEHGTEIHAHEALYEPSHNGCFTNHAYENLGGVAIFWKSGGLSLVQYHMKLFLNPYAIVPLADDLNEAFGV